MMAQNGFFGNPFTTHFDLLIFRSDTSRGMLITQQNEGFSISQIYHTLFCGFVGRITDA